MPEPTDTPRIVVGYDGSDAAQRGLARIRQLTAGQLAVLVVAVEPDVRSAGLGTELTGRTIATGPLLEEARALLGAQEGSGDPAGGDPACGLMDAPREPGAGSWAPMSRRNGG